MRSSDEILADAQTLFTFLSDAEAPQAPADVVLAMGSHDLRVAGTAVRAFRETQAKWLVCSGGFGKDTSGVLPEPEGVLYARKCQQAGIPEDRIFIESRASNSGENFLFSKKILESQNLFPRTGVIACKPYMARRAQAAGAVQWPEVRWTVFPQEITFTDYLAQGNGLKTVLDLMVGDLQRLRVYSGRFQAPVEVPVSIWAAYERLAADGYDRFVIRDA